MNNDTIRTFHDELYLEVKLNGHWILHSHLRPGTTLDAHNEILQAALTGNDAFAKAEYEYNKSMLNPPRKIRTNQGLPSDLSEITAHELNMFKSTPVCEGWLDANMLDALTRELTRVRPKNIYWEDEGDGVQMDVFSDILHAAVSTRNYLELGYEDIRLVYSYRYTPGEDMPQCIPNSVTSAAK